MADCMRLRKKEALYCVYGWRCPVLNARMQAAGGQNYEKSMTYVQSWSEQWLQVAELLSQPDAQVLELL